MLEIFTWILISDILVLIIVFFVGQRSCYFEADSPRIGGVVTSRWILLGGVVISRQILRVWRIIEAPTCWWRITEAPACWWRIIEAPACGWRIIEAPTCWLEDYLRYCLFGLFCR